MKKITILGATGSIGASTLSVIEHNRDDFSVYALAAHSNVDKMYQLCLKWQPEYAVMADHASALQLQKKLAFIKSPTSVLAGMDGLCEISSSPKVDMVMAAIVGSSGLLPTMAAVKAGKRILLANKESLVMSGQFFIDAAKQYGAQILPVDSEHNAIFQCLSQNVQADIGYCDLQANGVESILLTGSGGPFRYSDISTLPQMTPEMAIAHPNWSMGPKISVDSATMMNKGLEFIEAKWLFNARQDQLKVLIHPQSVIHSMVQYNDGSVIAQLGEPDMCTPIALSMSYPNRILSGVKSLDFTQLAELTFLAPDMSRYPCLQLAIDACYTGQHATTAINAANEVSVQAFLDRKLKFTDIAIVNDKIMSKVCRLSTLSTESLESLLELDRIARIYAEELVAERT
ncbi:MULTISPECIES: 1-deoxy-D-xylulose-5-phosphate reductoisomerase [Vibrio]|uniref:1-deoxy-D-xylulose 5-phosphate reductoisomerase n=1 Tax=Vibrio casei TaxID=673372 RepID=A0A368LLW4_9VIBR|nr:MULTISPECIES: 1-deoxy-D-xylulose-5-phosphate reductoisomerase [Vibrio]RCS72785.1 1-deoxy-D-xylulose-5-phosphate reductoisomerase [Vibrio casei]SJN39203.1 1-deoxy-D-xylulose 5-phosphate reductoisomerase [Vibrio casei]HBV74916.1 1-deoxy-D-xylulose-5-phosphate reductoisomerase [Vibrio sp.]